MIDNENEKDDQIILELIKKGTARARLLVSELKRVSRLTPKDKIYRRVDRSLQRLRKAGKIAFVEGEWVLVKL